MAGSFRIGSEILVNTATDFIQWLPQITALTNGGFVVTWTDFSRGVGGAPGDTSGTAVKAQVFAADGTKIGSEFLVNTTTVNDQLNAEIAALPDGGYVVTWTDGSEWIQGTTDYTNDAIGVQVFGADGTKIGAETLVNTASTVREHDPHVAVLSNGDFVVTWHDDDYGPPGLSSVKAQVFAAVGAKIGPEILVEDSVGPQITALTNGGFVVTYSSPDDAADVKAQVFAADGTRLGSEILVNTATHFPQVNPEITALANGGFVVTWDDFSQGSAIKAQVFAADGTKTGSELLVNTNNSAGGRVGQQVTSLADGGFVVTWAGFSQGDGPITTEVMAQVFAADGTKTGSELLVNFITAGRQDDQRITALSNGGFAVAWSAESQVVATPDDIKAQAFSANGTRIGSEILVNTGFGSNQGDHQITALPDGGFVVAWTTGNDGSNAGVKAQVFGVEGTGLGTPGDDNLVGNLGDDSIDGLAGNDRLQGLAGKDTLDGGAGVDTADYSEKTADVRVILYGATAATVTVAGVAEDTIRNIENVNGGRGNDTLTGDGLANVLSGREGNDTLPGGVGKDTLDGGAGDDTADYSEKTAGVYVTLNGATNASVSVAGIAEDTIRNIENVTGGNGNDRLTGDGLANVLTGNYGNDTLLGGGGDDRLTGGPGQDTLDGGEGNDTADYSAKQEWSPIVVTLNGATDASVTIGGVAEDTIRNIENLLGGADNDSLTGDGLANLLSGGGGNDTLAGGGGADLFRYAPGGDLDRVLDFQDDVDTIGLQGFGFASVEEALGFFTQSGGNVVFDNQHGGADVLIVHNVTIAQLADDILFV